MPTAAALRLEIERALERKFPAALTPAPRAMYEVAATGIRAVDELLYGGLPVGAISELTGATSSGRTSLALQFVAQRTAEGRACAWVDVSDAFDPESAAANGVRLKQLLWMRCENRDRATPASKDRSLGTPAGNKGTREQEDREQRSEIRKTGSEGARERESGVDGIRSHPKVRRDTANFRMGHPMSWKRPEWARLEQGLRATDLLLQAGGFSCVVLDLGDTAPEQASRIPLATWFRYRQAEERTQCSLVVVGARGYAQSAAAVVLECAARSAEPGGGTVLRGFEFQVRRERERQAPIEITTRKPGSPTTGPGRWGGKPPAATWLANAAWEADAGRLA